MDILEQEIRIELKKKEELLKEEKNKKRQEIFRALEEEEEQELMKRKTEFLVKFFFSRFISNIEFVVINESLKIRELISQK